MGWPFSTAVAPNLDSGYTNVPTGSTSITASAAWLIGAHFANGTIGTINVTVTDTAGNAILPAMPVGPGAVVSLEWAFIPSTGVKWFASSAGLTGKIWGYT